MNKENLFNEVMNKFNNYIKCCVHNFCRHYYKMLDTIYTEEDVVQMIYIHIWKYINRFDEKKSSLKTYMVNNMKQVFNRVIYMSLLQKRQAWKKSSFDHIYKQVDDTETTLYSIISDGDFEKEEKKVECFFYFSLMKSIQKVVFKMLHEGYTYEEIGEHLGVSRQRIGQIIDDVRKMVKKREKCGENRKVFKKN